MLKRKRKLSQHFAKTVSFTGNKALLSENVTRRGVWFFVIICAFSVLSYQLATVIIEYQSYRVNTVIINYMYGFSFPNVTVCKKQPFSLTKKPPEGVGIDRATRFWKYALNLTDSIDDQQKSYEKAMSSFHEYAYNKDVYSSLLDEIHVCHYMDKPCAHGNLLAIRDPSRLNCVTFAPTERRFVFTGAQYGLRLILSSGNSYAVGSPMNKFNVEEGFEVRIHNNYKDVIEVVPWNQVTVRLKMRNNSNVYTPQNKCYGPEKWTLDFTKAMELHFPSSKYGNCSLVKVLNQDDCLNIKFMIFGLRYCGCLPNNFNAPAPCSIEEMGPTCHSLPKQFFYNEGIDENGILIYNATGINLRNNSEFQKILKRAQCHDKYVRLTIDQAIQVLEQACPEQCKVTNYDAQVVNTNWQASYDDIFEIIQKYEKDYDPEDFQPEKHNKYNKNYSFSSILVYPSELNVEETSQSLAYPISKLVSDFGGSIGLWIGCSFLTVVELLEFIVNLIVSIFVNKKKKKDNVNGKEPKSSNNEDVELCSQS